MSILGTIYTGLSGMLGFSKGLDVISDNVANMNTPGFKGSNVRFEDLFYQHHVSSRTEGNLTGSQIGSGVKVADTSVSYNQGEIRSTGNQTDAAIDGNGYFILLDGNDRLYTRAGQFDFDADGYLVSQTSGLRVAGINSAGQLTEISVADVRTNPPVATTEVSFQNALSEADTTHEIDAITIFDSSGDSHTLRMVLTDNSAVTANSWTLEVFDQDSNSISTGEIRFQTNGTPAVGFNEHQFTYTPNNGAPVDLLFSFGSPGSFSGVRTTPAGNSSMEVRNIDGYGVGAISDLTFSDDGQITITYSNEQSVETDVLALAYFENQQALRKLGSGVFVNPIEQQVRVGKANEGVFGAIRGASLELSNVELTQQFTDLVIIQRGFQSSSQVLTVANEMVQELLNSSRGTG